MLTVFYVMSTTDLPSNCLAKIIERITIIIPTEPVLDKSSVPLVMSAVMMRMITRNIFKHGIK